MRRSNGGGASEIIASRHLVQLPVPDHGFGSDLNAMVEFYLEHGEELRFGCIKREPDHRACVLFCFRDPNNAADFARRFSGEVFDVPSDDDLFIP